VGWMLGAMEDESATFFFFLALYTQLRLKPKEHKGPYYLPALFLVLGSFCKITWLGFIPVLLFMDWVNYPQSHLGQRIVRFLPFLIFIPTLFLNILFIGFTHLSGTMAPGYAEYFNVKNLTFGSFLSFIPFDLSAYLNDYYLLMILTPILFFLLALLFNKATMRITAVGVAYLGTLLILGLAQMQKEPVGWIMGWRHLAPLVGLAAILIALFMGGLMDRLRWGFTGWLLPLALMTLLIWSGLPMTSTLLTDVENEGHSYQNMIRSFIVLCRHFEPKSEIYMLFKKSWAVNLLADLADNDHQLAMLFVKGEKLLLSHNYDLRSKHIIFKDKKDMMLFIQNLLAKNAKFISIDRNGCWINITDKVKSDFSVMLNQQH
jgi:hypothetical protein